MKRVYLASPYSSGKVSKSMTANLGSEPTRQAIMKERARLVREATATLMERGVNAYSPIAHGHDLPVSRNLVTSDEFWRPFNEDEIDRSDEVWVLMLDGWDTSTGVTREIAYAIKTGKPVCLLPLDLPWVLKRVPCPHGGGVVQHEGDMRCRWCNETMPEEAQVVS